MKYLILVLFLMGGISLNAQTVFEDYGGNPAVTHLNISPQMFQMLSKSTQEVQIAQVMETWMQKELQRTELTSILNMTEQGVNVQFAAVYGEGEAEVQRLVMFVKGLQEFIDKQDNINLDTNTKFDYVLLEIKGDIDLNQVGALTKLIAVPGGEYLESLQN